MAEVIKSWPLAKGVSSAQFVYPWAQWARLDENGHGDIWLAEQAVDFPADMVAANFRGVLYNRALRETNKRKKTAPMVLKPVKMRNTRTGEITEKVKRVQDFRPIRVKVVIVSAETIAFQFYDSEEPPPIPAATEVSVPRRRPIHTKKNRRVLEYA